MGVISSNKFKNLFLLLVWFCHIACTLRLVSEVKKKKKNGMEIENCFGKIHISEKETIKEIVTSTEKHQPRSYVVCTTVTTIQQHKQCNFVAHPTPSLPHPFTYSDMQTPVLHLSHNKVTFEGLLTAIRNPSIRSNMRIIICNFVTIFLFI